MEKDYFNDFMTELKQKSDIVAIASKYANLERKGRYYWCRCPFHGEKTPSLCINDIDNFFYCYGCHTGGNVITFVMKIESLSFMEAVRLLASWANLEVPETNSGKSSESIEKAKQRKDRLLSLLKETAIHYHNNLKTENAVLANEYLKKRQLEENTINKFGLGYSIGYQDLPEYLTQKGFTIEEMLSAGVIKKREKDGKTYDPLANRVIFPIIDIYGNVIAFGGRTLESHPEFAKYLNTAETELFNKRNTLYAINYLKKQRTKGPIPYVIVVEGYMDTISLHRADFTMTVASMGTALTQNQAKLIKRFADKVYICYDGDSAGQNATLRGLDILRENGLDVFVVELPDKFDPDDVIKSYGREGYLKCLESSLPLIEFKIKYLKSKYDFKNVDSRAKFLNEAIDVLSQISNGVERELYIPMVSELSSTNIDFIRREVDKKIDGKYNSEEVSKGLSTVSQVVTVPENEIEVEDDKVIRAEKYILYSLIHSKPYAHFKNNAEFLFSGKRKDFYNLVELKKSALSGIELLQSVYDSFDDNSFVADIVNFGAVSAEDTSSENKYYKDCLWVLYKNFLEKEQSRLLSEYEKEIDILIRNKITEKIHEITQKLKNKSVEEL